MDKVSYALGLGIGHQLLQMGANDLNIDDFAAAIKDVLAGNDLKVSNREAQTIVESYFKAKEEKLHGNLVVLSAASGDETAYPYREKGHGMFTYFLLKKLQETKGAVTLGELSDYVTTNVKRQSVVTNRKSQTPTVIYSESVGMDWRKISF